MPMTQLEETTHRLIQGACRKITQSRDTKRLIAGVIFAHIVSPACIDHPDIRDQRVKDAVDFTEAIFAEVERRDQPKEKPKKKTEGDGTA